MTLLSKNVMITTLGSVEDPDDNLFCTVANDKSRMILSTTYDMKDLKDYENSVCKMVRECDICEGGPGKVHLWNGTKEDFQNVYGQFPWCSEVLELSKNYGDNTGFLLRIIFFENKNAIPLILSDIKEQEYYIEVILKEFKKDNN